MKVHPLAVSVIKQYLSGNNFKKLEKVLPLSKAKKINFLVLKDLAETLADSNKFEETFPYDLLLGNRYLGDQHTIDSDEKVEFFQGTEFCSLDLQTTIKDAFITLFLSDNLSDKKNVILITNVDGGTSIFYKLFYRVNIIEKKVDISHLDQALQTSRKAA